MKNSTVLQVDDLEVGMFVTVHTGETRQRIIPNGPMSTEIIIEEDKIFKGEVLKIICIDFPYIVVEFIFFGDRKKKRDRLDIRDVKLKMLSDDYVRAYKPEMLSKIKEWKKDER